MTNEIRVGISGLSDSGDIERKIDEKEQRVEIKRKENNHGIGKYIFVSLNGVKILASVFRILIGKHSNLFFNL